MTGVARLRRKGRVLFGPKKGKGAVGFEKGKGVWSELPAGRPEAGQL